MRFFCVVCCERAGDCASGVKASWSKPRKNGELEFAPRCRRRCMPLVGGDCIKANRQGDPATTLGSICGNGELNHGKSESLQFFIGVPAGVVDVPVAVLCMSNKQASTPPAVIAERFGERVSSMKSSWTPCIVPIPTPWLSPAPPASAKTSSGFSSLL